MADKEKKRNMEMGLKKKKVDILKAFWQSFFKISYL